MHPRTTKNDLYAELIALGVQNGYTVIPEFRVKVRDSKNKIKNKSIDLVWAIRVNNTRQCGTWQEHWRLVATFEIEACDVGNINKEDFTRHLSELPQVKNNCQTKIHHFIALYSSAYDRKWIHARPFLAEIRERKQQAKRTGVKVLDGRSLSALDRFESLVLMSKCNTFNEKIPKHQPHKSNQA